MTTHVYQNSRTFDAKDYEVHEANFARLDNPRPLGLTGHLRVRDEAMSLRACLDSCLPFLDEIIITYNDSTDETEAILLEYAAKYPEKIRLFWYPLEFGRRYGEEAVIPLGHIANFYNYGYTKTSYHYYMKIDADQIYFTEKMCHIREILCALPKQKRVWENIPKWLRRVLRSCQKKKARLAKIFSCTKKDKTVADIMREGLQSSFPAFFVLGGVNISFAENAFRALPSNSPLNGCVGDTSIFAPSSVDRYVMHEDTHEIFCSHYSRVSLPLGFAWVHTCFVKRKMFEHDASLCPLEDIAQQSWDNVHAFFVHNDIEKKLKPLQVQHYVDWGATFWEKDIRTYCTPTFYNSYFPQILDYVRKNYHNSISYADKLRGIGKK